MDDNWDDTAATTVSTDSHGSFGVCMHSDNISGSR